VEAALVTPLVLALFFGIIETGFVFKDQLAVAGAVRAGARMASASPRTATFAQSAVNQVVRTGGAVNFNALDKNGESVVKEMWVYKVDPLPPLGTGTDKPIGSGNFDGCTTCVKFGWDPRTKEFVPTYSNWPSGSQNACSASTVLGPPDRIGVYIKIRHEPFTGFVFPESVFPNGITVSEASILTLEPMPIAGGCRP
jgi:hypothetical protein